MNAIIREIYEWLYSIVIALAIAMVIHIFFLQPTRVSGESMVPTLHNGEYLVVEKWDHIFRNEPNYGDIVIIDSRVLYDRTWLDDAVEPLHNYLAFFDSKLQTKNVWVKQVIGKTATGWPFMTARFGATAKPSTNRTSIRAKWITAAKARSSCPKAVSSVWVTIATTVRTAVSSVPSRLTTSSARLFGSPVSPFVLY